MSLTPAELAAKFKQVDEACPCRNYKGSDCCAGTPTVCICRVMFTGSVYNIPQVKCSWRGHAAIDKIVVPAQPDPDAKRRAAHEAMEEAVRLSESAAASYERGYRGDEKEAKQARIEAHAAIDAIPDYYSGPVPPNDPPTSAEVEEAILHYGLASQDFQAHVITVFQLKEKLAKTLLVIDRCAAEPPDMPTCQELLDNAKRCLDATREPSVPLEADLSILSNIISESADCVRGRKALAGILADRKAAVEAAYHDGLAIEAETYGTDNEKAERAARIKAVEEEK